MDYVYSVERLSRVLKPVSTEQDADAAVALLLKHANEEGFRILFVKRAENHVDPWSGQMAFPGGKRSPEDQSLRQTVVRETLEETNINLLDRCRFLGARAKISLGGSYYYIKAWTHILKNMLLRQLKNWKNLACF